MKIEISQFEDIKYFANTWFDIFEQLKRLICKDAWSDTYNNEEVFKWLLGNKNENVKTITDIYKNSKIYG